MERADRWLDAVERCVLLRDPKAALQLLARFMDSIEQISEHCWDDDFGSSQLSDRAWTMVERLAATLSAKDVGPAIERLRVEFVARGCRLSR